MFQFLPGEKVKIRRTSWEYVKKVFPKVSPSRTFTILNCNVATSYCYEVITLKEIPLGGRFYSGDLEKL